MAGEDEVAPQVSQIVEEFATFGVTLSDEVASQCEWRAWCRGGGCGRPGEGGRLGTCTLNGAGVQGQGQGMCMMQRIKV